MTIDRLATTDAPLAGDALAGFRFTVVPHTHWDREWYQPFEVFRLRLARMIDELIDLLDRDPAFTTFVLDGQAVILEDYLDLRPEREADVRRLLAGGRLVTGPSYVLPDEYLASQEALIRNLLMGRRVMDRFGARSMAVGYHPDPFGHVAQLPQILRGFGLDSFVFWRGLGDEANDVGIAFDWEAPDGSRVLAVRQLGGYGNACHLGRWASGGIDMADRPDTWPAVAAQRLARHVSVFAPEIARTGTREALASNGSDHEGPHHRLPELVAAIREAHPATEVEIGTFEDYVDRLSASITVDLPVIRGELCGGRDAPVLRGINSTRLELKQAAEATERALLQAEALASLAMLSGRGTADHRAVLERGWRELLRNLPHDSISGCSVDRVHRDMQGRFSAADQLAGRVAQEALAALADAPIDWQPTSVTPAVVSVVNAIPHARSAVVEVPVPRSLVDAADLRTGEGTAAQRAMVDGHPVALVPVELTGFEARDVALGTGAGRRPPGAVEAGPRSLENGTIRVEIADDGTFSIVELATGRRVDGLGRLEDVADRGDEYTFCPVEGDQPVGAPSEVAIAVRTRGPVIGELEIRRRIALPARLSADRRRRVGSVDAEVVTVVRLAAAADLVEVAVSFDNRSEDHRLRMHFPAPDTTFRSTVRAEGHFAVVHRPPRPIWSGGGWTEPPAPTHHTTGFVAAGDLFVAGRGLPEYEAVVTRDGTQAIAMTLLRSVGWLSRDDLATRPGGAGPSVETPEAQGLGPRSAQLAVGIGASRASDADLVRRSAGFRFPALVAPAGVRLPSITVAGDVAVAALKLAEDDDGAVLRVYNPGPDPVTPTIEWDGPSSPVRLDETRIDPLTATMRGGEIRSFRLRRRARRAG